MSKKRPFALAAVVALLAPAAAVRAVRPPPGVPIAAAPAAGEAAAATRPAAVPAPSRGPAAAAAIQVVEADEQVTIETDVLAAAVRKTGYVSGIAGGSLLDKKTGARDLGFGLHVMDFLMAPGWRADGYERDAKVHGDLPKHYVEGPQLCTQAKRLPVEVVRGDGFIAVRARYTYDKPGDGYKAGSTWEQTIVFRPGLRYVLSAERITVANVVPDPLFYRLDMPGHIRHGGDRGEPFAQVYLSYRDDPFVPASAFAAAFAPDAKFLYHRRDGQVPGRFIRGYQVKQDGMPGPWLAGMTLDPAVVYEAWCHQRGYVCFIEELHGRPTKAGQTIGAAYVVGWFDDVPDMQRTYDRYKGTTGLSVEGGKLELTRAVGHRP